MKSENKSLSSYFDETAVTYGKLLFASFLLEHNILLIVFDYAKNLFRAIVPESKIV